MGSKAFPYAFPVPTGHCRSRNDEVIYVMTFTPGITIMPHWNSDDSCRLSMVTLASVHIDSPDLRAQLIDVCARLCSLVHKELVFVVGRVYAGLL